MRTIRLTALVFTLTIFAACNMDNADNPANSAESPESDTATATTDMNMDPVLVTDSVQVDNTNTDTTMMR